MRASKENGLIRLEFAPAEVKLLLRVLESIAQVYRTDPATLAPRESSALYSTRGCESAGLGAEETRDWLRQLFEFRSASLELLEDWIAHARQARREPLLLDLNPAQAPEFVRILNDHRLLLAARHEIGESEMQLRFLQALFKLPAQRQSALLEIEWLAHMIEAVLASLPNSGADWDRSLVRPETD